jgi:adenosylhomocysteine nucleosidase
VPSTLPDHPCILFALRRESAPFCRDYRPQQAFPGSPCWAHYCDGPQRILVAETGVGHANVGRVLAWLLAKPLFDGAPYEPRLIVFAGFAGALTDALAVGDIVRPAEVADEAGQCWKTTGPTPTHGRLLTVDHLTATEADKRRLGQQHQAIAVDMESAHFAARCTRAGVRFACVRAISDTVTTALSPALLSLLNGGNTSAWRVLKTLARHPAMLPELMQLAHDTKHASRQLATALRELLAITASAGG